MNPVMGQELLPSLAKFAHTLVKRSHDHSKFPDPGLVTVTLQELDSMMTLTTHNSSQQPVIVRSRCSLRSILITALGLETCPAHAPVQAGHVWHVVGGVELVGVGGFGGVERDTVVAVVVVEVVVLVDVVEVVEMEVTLSLVLMDMVVVVVVLEVAAVVCLWLDQRQTFAPLCSPHPSPHSKLDPPFELWPRPKHCYHW